VVGDPGFSVSTEFCEDVPVVFVTGEVDIATAPALRRALASWEEEPELPFVVVDLSNVGFIDSTGMGALVAFHKRIHNEVRIVVTEHIKKVMKLTALDQVFSLFDTVREAVFAAPRPALSCDGLR
jgi:anti-sigma B factor antagonist